MGTIWGMICTQLYQVKLLHWYMTSFWLRLVNNVQIIWFFSLMTINDWQFYWLLHLEKPKMKSFRWGLYCGWQWRKLNFDIFDRDSSSLFDTWLAKYVVFKNLLDIRCCWQMCSENWHFHVFCPVCSCLPLDFPFSRKGANTPLLL